MEGKRYRLTINGFPVEAEFPRREMEQAIDPLIDALLALRGRLSRRAVAFLAGPPGAGKSTLAEVLCARAAERQADARVQALGLDGFHYPNAYLNETYRMIDGARTRLRDVKGRLETFDVRHFGGNAGAGANGEWRCLAALRSDDARRGRARRGCDRGRSARGGQLAFAGRARLE